MDFEFYWIYKDYISVINYLILVITSLVIWSLARGLLKSWSLRKLLPPGPMGIPIFGALPFLGPEPHKKLYQLKEQYGDIIGLYLGRTYTVVLNEYSVAKEVLSHPAALNRSPHIFHHIPQFGFITENGESWIEQRRFCVSVLKDLGFSRIYWEEIVADEVHHFVEFLKKCGGKPTYIDTQLKISIYSNVITFLIGRRLDKDKEADTIELLINYSDVIFSNMGPASIMSLFPGLWKIFKMIRIADYGRIAHTLEAFSAFIRGEIKNHKESKSLQVHDFLSTYLEELNRIKKEGSIKPSFSEAMLEGNAVGIFVGSSDTIFSSLQRMFRLMSEYRDIQAKVYAELMDALGEEEKAKYEERDKIPYTFAVIMESLRFSSFVALTPSRILAQDIEVRGLTIPKGTEITANIWALHNDPNYWEVPEKFNPDRFLTDNGRKLVKNPPSYFVFSIGRRNCPGETTAWMEILTYFTEIIRKFEISTSPGVKTEYATVKGLIANLKQQLLCFKERERKQITEAF